MKDKWVKCLVSDLISSEESDEKNDSSVVKPLPWWAQKVMEFFKKLFLLMKTSQGKHQQKYCIQSSLESSRPKPASGVPKWAYITD